MRCGSDDRRLGSGYRVTRPGTGEGGVPVPVLRTGPGAAVCVLERGPGSAAVAVAGTVDGVVVVAVGSWPRRSMSQISAE